MTASDQTDLPEVTSPTSDSVSSESPAAVPPSHSRLAAFVHLLVTWRLALAGLALLFTAASWLPARQLSLERSIESLFAPTDPLLLDYQQSKNWFGGDEFVMVAWQQENLLDATGLSSVRELAKQLNAVPGVNPASTQTLTAVLQPQGMGIFGTMFLRIPSIRYQALEFAEGALVGVDRKTTAIVLRLLPENDSPAPRGETFARIQELVDARSEPTFIVGEPVQVHEMFEIVEQDGYKLGLASAGILLVIIFLLFRSLRWMLLPIVIVQLALLWTRATLVVSGIRLSMVSSMLDSLVTIIGIATVMHLTVTYRNHRKELGRQAALEQTLIDLLPAIGWTCATTAVGFAALMSSHVVPIESFGLMMGIGTLMVLLAVLTVVPALVLTGSWAADPGHSWGESRLIAGLLRILEGVFRFPRLLLAVTCLLTLFGLSGLPQLRIETDFSKNFHETNVIAQALRFVEVNLGGAGSYEVNFEFEDLDNSDQQDRLRQLASKLRELNVAGEPAVTKAIAYTDGIDFMPTMGVATLERKRQLLEQMQPEFVPSLYNAEDRRMRILLRAFEQQPAELKLEKIAAVRELAAQQFEDVHVTGLYVLLANIIQSLLADQVVSFSLAATGIFLMMSFAFRSWLVGLIALVPNLFPIIVLIGGLGWIGSLINIGTAMIASVSIGLTVDSSIHYLSAYRRARRAGEDHPTALRTTQSQIGLSLVFANLALICGFSVLILSEFVPLNYFGILVSIAMLGGLLGNILLLPLALNWLRPVAFERLSQS